ncbi:MAG: hypothetical protein ABI361_08580 [Nitrososphaera sp.]
MRTSENAKKTLIASSLAAVLLVSVVTLSFGPRLANAAAYTLDENTCTSALAGTWASNTCEVSGLNIQPADSLKIPAGVILTLDDANNFNQGIIDNSGAIIVSTEALLVNTGEIRNYNTIVIQPAVGTFGPGILDDTNGSIFNFCALPITVHGTLQGHLPVSICSSISVSPIGAPVGATVRISGVNLAPDTQVTVKLGNVVATTLPSTITTDSRGTFTATFTVPIMAGGPTVVSAGEGSTAFTVLSTISSGANSATTGGTVSLSGTGFGSDSVVALTLDGVAQPTTPVIVSTNANGLFNATLIVPLTGEVAGIHEIVAVDSSSHSAFRPLRIVPSISLSPGANTANSTVTVNGTGFAASSTITLSFGALTLSNTTPSTITTDSTGSFSASFTVPANAQARTFNVRAIDGSGDAARSPFTVVTGS